MSETGSVRGDGFLDGEHFGFMVKKGQAPVNAAKYALSRRLNATDMTLWPVEPTPAGEMYRATWFDKKAEVFREAKVEIWHIYQRPKEQSEEGLRRHHGDRRRFGNEPPPPTLTIRGRDYRVETVFEPKDEKKIRYLLHGPRGAKYTTMCNVHHADFMFLLDDRKGRISGVMDGVWLSDKAGAGTLRVTSQ